MTNGLNIPQPLGIGTMAVGNQQQQQIHAQWYTSDNVERELTSWGFPPMAPPECTKPVITPDLLTSPDTRRYTEVFHQATEWLSYSINVQARIKNRLLEITNEMGRIELEVKEATIKIAKDAGQKKPSKELLDDLYKSHPRWTQLLYEKQIEQQKKNQLDSWIDRFDKDYKRMSRQIELRKEEYGARSIGGNIGHRPQAGPGLYPNP